MSVAWLEHWHGFYRPYPVLRSVPNRAQPGLCVQATGIKAEIIPEFDGLSNLGEVLEDECGPGYNSLG
jgi:hypothetical protein